MHLPLVLLCLLGEPLLDLFAGLRLELVFTLLDGLLALKLVSEELHCPFVGFVKTVGPWWDMCVKDDGSVLVRFMLFNGGIIGWAI